MAVPWPTALQELVNENGFAENFGETVLRSDMDVGPAKYRRRTTRPINTLSITINLTVSQYTTFKTFFNTTTNGGVTPFTFAHPITGTATDFRFTKPPSIRSLGGGQFQALMEWEAVS